MASRTLDEVLSAKNALDAELCNFVRERIAETGIEVTELGVKDVILPGEIRELVRPRRAAHQARAPEGVYRVTKKINGRFYDYWQRTYRVGKSVKTENRYIGPARRDGLFTATGSAAPQRDPLYPGQFEISIGGMSNTENRKPRNIRELKKEKNAIMLATEFDAPAFSAVQDELDYAYAVKADKEKKRAARANTKDTKALNAFIAQTLLSRKGQ